MKPLSLGNGAKPIRAKYWQNAIGDNYFKGQQYVKPCRRWKKRLKLTGKAWCDAPRNPVKRALWEAKNKLSGE